MDSFVEHEARGTRQGPAPRTRRARLLLAASAGIGVSILMLEPAWTQAGSAAPPPQQQGFTGQPASGPSSSSPGQPSPGQASLAQPDETPAARRPGFVDELQKLLPPLPSLASPQETFENLNNRARDLTRLPKQEMVSGRMKCPLAANGAPDCKIAATRMCTDAGYKGGRSIDSDSAEDCPASVLLADKAPQPVCKVENFVLRALCDK